VTEISHAGEVWFKGVANSQQVCADRSGTDMVCHEDYVEAEGVGHRLHREVVELTKGQIGLQMRVICMS
jgi:hypothetical protein